MSWLNSVDAVLCRICLHVLPVAASITRFAGAESAADWDERQRPGICILRSEIWKHY